MNMSVKGKESQINQIMTQFFFSQKYKVLTILQEIILIVQCKISSNSMQARSQDLEKGGGYFEKCKRP